MTIHPEHAAWKPSAEEVQARLDEIERVLKFDARHPDRKQLIREYITLTEPTNG